MTSTSHPPGTDRARAILANRPRLAAGLQIVLVVVLAGSLVTLRFVGENRRAPRSPGEVITWALAVNI